MKRAREDGVLVPDRLGPPDGDARTFFEYRTMLEQAGFGRTPLHDLPPSAARIVIAER